MCIDCYNETGTFLCIFFTYSIFNRKERKKERKKEPTLTAASHPMGRTATPSSYVASAGYRWECTDFTSQKVIIYNSQLGSRYSGLMI
jgi:hypothetical protein